ncbi:glyoxalase family protein [Agrilactobacillus composti DSM 18527 = JCM 14202]|uniref:Glyoxalase family protein n=1 Tax=Agrilactobacillus composti DSM 18527 = JCM 14202 TaxID=1423734 RepID=X0QM08_9LACO|nr:VOC family protein [Agrilactobacillus composti]KRM35786.1 glyoxalase family protein [Agrilactobacillus composti DSM 18527 = JCM 14202]GAF39650.1 glyoxalase family protein [Agrilactobacillus composti DSM 18527 = JCM 14202]
MTDIHHISLLTHDKDVNQHFYTTILGFRLVKNTVNQENIHMRHLFYGDYLGSPDSITSFFEVHHLGPRYDGNSYLNGIYYGIPAASFDFWQARLTEQQIPFQISQQTIQFFDPDQVAITLQPVDHALNADQVVPNDIPGAYQISGILGTELRVPEIEASANFFETYLNLPFKNGAIQLANGHFIKIMNSNSTEKHRFGRGSMDHVAFTVADDAALKQMVQKAKAQHWDLEVVRNRGWFKSLYIQEPNHNRIELATMGPGFTLDEPLESLGETLGLPAHLENKRAEILAYLAQTPAQ